MLFIGVVFSCPNRVNVWCPTNLCWRGCSQIVQCSPQVANCGVVMVSSKKTVVQICDMRWCGVLVVLKNHTTMVVWMSMSFSMLVCQFSCVDVEDGWTLWVFISPLFHFRSSYSLFPFCVWSLSVSMFAFGIQSAVSSICLSSCLIPIILHEWSLPCVLILVVS